MTFEKWWENKLATFRFKELGISNVDLVKPLFENAFLHGEKHRETEQNNPAKSNTEWCKICGNKSYILRVCCLGKD